MALASINPGVVFGPVDVPRHALTSPGMLKVLCWAGLGCCCAGMYAPGLGGRGPGLRAGGCPFPGPMVRLCGPRASRASSAPPPLLPLHLTLALALGPHPCLPARPHTRHAETPGPVAPPAAAAPQAPGSSPLPSRVCPGPSRPYWRGPSPTCTLRLPTSTTSRRPCAPRSLTRGPRGGRSDVAPLVLEQLLSCAVHNAAYHKCRTKGRCHVQVRAARPAALSCARCQQCSSPPGLAWPGAACCMPYVPHRDCLSCTCHARWTSGGAGLYCPPPTAVMRTAQSQREDMASHLW